MDLRLPFSLIGLFVLIMLKQSPNRIQRSKGYKVKHVVQVFVVLAIVFWLINQLKHSYYNKKKFEVVTNGSKASENVLNDSDEMIKLGRKDLHPRVEGTVMDSASVELDSGELEKEIEEIKPEEVDDDGSSRGGGDDEIDSHDQEEVAEEAEDLIDDVDDREREEGGGEELESDDNKLEAESSIDDQSEDGRKDESSIMQNKQSTGMNSKLEVSGR